MYMLGSAGVMIVCIVVVLCLARPKAKIVKKERSAFGKLLQKAKKELSSEFDKFLQEINPPLTSEKENTPASLCCKSNEVDKTASEYEIVKIHDDKEFSTFKIKLASGKVVFVKKDKKKNVYWLM